MNNQSKCTMIIISFISQKRVLYRCVHTYLWAKRAHESIDRNLKLPARNAKHAPHLFLQRPHILLHFLLHSLRSHWELHHLIFVYHFLAFSYNINGAVSYSCALHSFILPSSPLHRWHQAFAACEICFGGLILSLWGSLTLIFMVAARWLSSLWSILFDEYTSMCLSSLLLMMLGFLSQRISIWHILVHF